MERNLSAEALCLFVCLLVCLLACVVCCLLVCVLACLCRLVLGSCLVDARQAQCSLLGVLNLVGEELEERPEQTRKLKTKRKTKNELNRPQSQALLKQVGVAAHVLLNHSLLQVVPQVLLLREGSLHRLTIQTNKKTNKQAS